MKNIFLGSIFMLVILPQMSFGADSTPVVVPPTPIIDPRVQACEQKMSEESNAFFMGQASERGTFLGANPTIIAKHDLRFKELQAIRVAQLKGESTVGLPVPDEEDPIFSDFFAKQLGDKQVFLGKLAQDKQDCLNSTGAVAKAN